tara:strand:- start:6832 stop:7530 length:699 start_codon:yes stop_codon:yes gene_type:complete
MPGYAKGVAKKIYKTLAAKKATQKAKKPTKGRVQATKAKLRTKKKRAAKKTTTTAKDIEGARRRKTKRGPIKKAGRSMSQRADRKADIRKKRDILKAGERDSSMPAVREWRESERGWTRNYRKRTAAQRKDPKGAVEKSRARKIEKETGRKARKRKQQRKVRKTELNKVSSRVRKGAEKELLTGDAYHSLEYQKQLMRDTTKKGSRATAGSQLRHKKRVTAARKRADYRKKY